MRPNPSTGLKPVTQTDRWQSQKIIISTLTTATGFTVIINVINVQQLEAINPCLCAQRPIMRIQIFSHNRYLHDPQKYLQDTAQKGICPSTQRGYYRCLFFSFSGINLTPKVEMKHQCQRKGMSTERCPKVRVLSRIFIFTVMKFHLRPDGSHS